MNPNDERYKDLVGKKLILPLVHREIPLIADDYVDMEFGTGVVKITPAHDPNDFEVGLRHDLPIINVMTDDAKIVDEYEKYAGMDRYEARKAIVEDLEKEGALVKIEDNDHNVGTCYRCGTTVEPRVSKQWFVKMKPLAGPAIDAVKEGALCIEKLEAMTCVCSVGLDMIAIPGDTKPTTIAGIIADESAIGMINQKTTAVRVIPVIGKGVGEMVEFGGLLGYAPIMPVNNFSCDAFVNRTGRIPAPIHSFKN